jgi:hypothetical protein
MQIKTGTESGSPTFVLAVAASAAQRNIRSNIMNRVAPFAIAMLLAGSSAIAQTQPQTTPAPSAPTIVTPSPSVTPTTPSTAPGQAMTLTDEQANSWVDKVVYSSDAKNVGEVAAVQRDSTGKVTELHADIGGFLGLGETRVRVMPGQFKLENDRIVLNMDSEQVRALPKITK